MTRYGEVVRLQWRTLTGEFTLIALTPTHQLLDMTQCLPADLDAATASLYSELADHAIRHRASASSQGAAQRRGLRLISSA
jgi:hypothetical protein